jgi:hypothetical protein
VAVMRRAVAIVRKHAPKVADRCGANCWAIKARGLRLEPGGRPLAEGSGVNSRIAPTSRKNDPRRATFQQFDDAETEGAHRPRWISWREMNREVNTIGSKPMTASSRGSRDAQSGLGIPGTGPKR